MKAFSTLAVIFVALLPKQAKSSAFQNWPTAQSQSSGDRLLDNYNRELASCRWGFGSRASSRNYKNGTTRTEVDNWYEACKRTALARYERIRQQQN